MLERVNDLITYRIDAILDEIADMSLCDLPDDDVITPEDFYKHIQVDSHRETRFFGSSLIV